MQIFTAHNSGAKIVKVRLNLLLVLYQKQPHGGRDVFATYILFDYISIPMNLPLSYSSCSKSL